MEAPKTLLKKIVDKYKASQIIAPQAIANMQKVIDAAKAESAKEKKPAE